MARKIEKLLRKGARAEAMAVLQEYNAAQEKPTSRFEGFARLREVPLALSAMDPLCREILDEAGYYTVGDIDQASDEELCSLKDISKKRLKRIRDGVEEVAGEYITWRIAQDDLEFSGDL